MLGFEIETWIVDHNYFPSSINQQLLEALDNPLVVPELSRFNLELNFAPLPLEGDALGRAHDALAQVWGHCNDEAHRLDANLVLIGTLPTIRDEDLTLDNMSPLNRYYALNAEVLRMRGGRPYVYGNLLARAILHGRCLPARRGEQVPHRNGPWHAGTGQSSRRVCRAAGCRTGEGPRLDPDLYGVLPGDTRLAHHGL
jgi:hypothetical protein